MLNACLIGYGYWGSKLARNFQNSEDFNLVSIADIKKKNLNFAKKNYQLTQTYKNYKEAIKIICRKFSKEKTGKKPITNISLVRI